MYTDLGVLMNPKSFVLYGDPAYPHRGLLQRPFGGASLTVGQATFNYQMSRVRQSVEWGFGKVATEFAFLDLKKKSKVVSSAVAHHIQGRRNPDELPHLFVRESNFNVLFCRSSNTGGVLDCVAYFVLPF